MDTPSFTPNTYSTLQRFLDSLDPKIPHTVDWVIKQATKRGVFNPVTGAQEGVKPEEIQYSALGQADPKEIYDPQKHGRAFNPKWTIKRELEYPEANFMPGNVRPPKYNELLLQGRMPPELARRIARKEISLPEAHHFTDKWDDLDNELDILTGEPLRESLATAESINPPRHNVGWVAKGQYVDASGHPVTVGFEVQSDRHQEYDEQTRESQKEVRLRAGLLALLDDPESLSLAQAVSKYNLGRVSGLASDILNSKEPASKALLDSLNKITRPIGYERMSDKDRVWWNYELMRNLIEKHRDAPLGSYSIVGIIETRFHTGENAHDIYRDRLMSNIFAETPSVDADKKEPSAVQPPLRDWQKALVGHLIESAMRDESERVGIAAPATVADAEGWLAPSRAVEGPDYTEGLNFQGITQNYGEKLPAHLAKQLGQPVPEYEPFYLGATEGDYALSLNNDLSITRDPTRVYDIDSPRQQIGWMRAHDLREPGSSEYSQRATAPRPNWFDVGNFKIDPTIRDEFDRLQTREPLINDPGKYLSIPSGPAITDPGKYLGDFSGPNITIIPENPREQEGIFVDPPISPIARFGPVQAPTINWQQIAKLFGIQ